jgi:hypothetical protein
MSCYTHHTFLLGFPTGWSFTTHQYVQQHQLFFLRCDQDWGRRESALKVVERGMHLCYPSKVVRLPKEPIKREGLFAQLADESAERG